MASRIISVLFSIFLLVPVLQGTENDTSTLLPGYNSVDSTRQRLSRLPLHTIEGIWRFPSDGGLIVIERDKTAPGDTYNMIALYPQNRLLRPGTLMGTLTATAKRGVFDARLFTKLSGEKRFLTKAKKFVLTLQDSNTRFTLQPYGKKYEVRWWHVFPYMYRRIITRSDNTPQDLDGCLRVFPEPLPPANPIYL